MRYTFVIVDDDGYFAALLKKRVAAVFSDACIEVFTDTVSLSARHEIVSAYFLDIEMPGQDGFVLASELRAQHDDVPILFITSHAELWPESYKFQAFWYIDKARLDDSLPEALMTLSKRLAARNKSVMVDMKNGDDVAILLGDIDYLYRFGNGVIAVTNQGQGLVRDSFKRLLPLFDEKRFLRINAAIIIRRQAILCFNRTSRTVTMSDGGRLSVSRRYQAAVMAAMGVQDG